jgi:multidrug efflux system membrane fusion protein
MRLKPSHAIAGGLVLALAGWLLSGQLDADPAAPPESAPRTTAAERPLPAVRVREVTAAPVAREIVINGKTAPARSVELRAETNGRVVEIGARRGAKVAAGDLVLRLDPRERRAMVEEARAALKMRRIEADAAEKLGEKGFQAETKVAAARANLEAAQAALEHAELELDHTEIEAPFAGVLEARPVEIGDFVDVGDAVATVIEQDPFLVVGEAAETEIGALHRGMQGTARLITGDVVAGRLRYVGSRADPATRTFRVELEVANPSERFVAGASAELHLQLETVEAHKLSPGVLTLNDDGELGVKAVSDQDVVVFHPATVVRAEADAVWLAGLPERLRLITVGQGFVRAGDRVRAVSEAAIDGAPRPAGGATS